MTGEELATELIIQAQKLQGTITQKTQQEVRVKLLLLANDARDMK